VHVVYNMCVVQALFNLPRVTTEQDIPFAPVVKWCACDTE